MATENTSAEGVAQVAGDAAAQSSGGMPQLDFSTWASQIFWTALALFILYKVLNGSILPKISGALEDRHNAIATDTAQAIINKLAPGLADKSSIEAAVARALSASGVAK